MTRIAKAILRRFGIIAVRQSSRVYLEEEDSYRIAASQCGRADPVIIDGGAHRGASVKAFARFVPQAEFHCFEPDPLLAGELARTFAGNKNVHPVQAALGESPGKATFNINASRPANSLLPTANNLDPGLQALCQPVEKIEVDVTSIDSYCAARGLERIDIIKLDLQGYDYQALLGAKSVMRSTRIVLVEVLFAEIYRGCHLFPEILHLMKEQGFALFTLCGFHYGKAGELQWADAIFVNPCAPLSSPPPQPAFRQAGR